MFDSALPPDSETTPDPWRALNAAQRRAVDHGEGPSPACALMVIAGAGSGKTHMLAHRLARLVGDGADPHRILLLTFSRRAAQELERRCGHVLAKLASRRNSRPASLPWAGTFHAIGARLLREYAARVGLADAFTIHDRGDSEDLMGLVRARREVDFAERRFPGAATCVAIYSRTVNSEASLHDVLDSAFPWCASWERELCALFGDYVSAKQEQQVLDYDDLLLYWAGMMAEPPLAAAIGERFDHVLVDEYQDTNRLQATILRGLKPDGRGVTVVGDDAQAIYGFRATTVRNILDFPTQFAAERVTLERNYRSTQPILDASNAVIALAAERFSKQLFTERAGGARPLIVAVHDETEQARYVAERVLDQRESGIGLRSQAVLFRTSSHSAELELELARRDIPFVKFGGLRFLETAHMKDVLSLLRWAENPRGRIAGFRAARLLPGIGAAIATRLLDAMDAAADPLAAMRAFRMPMVATAVWSSWLELYRRLRTSAWPDELERVIAWYAPQMARLYDEVAPREADLAQLARIAATYPSRERFLTELALDPPGPTGDAPGPPHRDEDYLILSTIHSAKGQEWKSVQILNAVDGCIPSDLATGTSAEIEEERRLLYVAMTRAKDHLALIVPQCFHVRKPSGLGDRQVRALRTRFIPDAICTHFELTSWPALAADAATQAAAPRVVDLRERVRTRWQA